MSDQLYCFNFVTDPDDPNVYTQYDDLIKLINDDDNILLTEDNLDRGLVRYNIDTIYNYDEYPNHIQKIQKIIGDISYVPITVSMRTDGFENNIGSILTRSQEIIKYLTESIIKTNIINVKISKHDNNIVIFNPITDHNTSVYINPLYLSNYYNTINMEKLGGYQVLSVDPLVRYVLNDLYNSKRYVPSDINVLYVNNIALVPVGNINNENYYTDIVNTVESMIRKKRSNGYFVYDIGIHNIEDLKLISELAHLWNTKVIYSEDMVNIVLQTTVDFGIKPEIWFRHNLPLIKLGYFPTITLYGEWQFLSNDIENFNDTILNYGALLAYRNMGDEDNFIKPFTSNILINNDLSITISIPTYNHSLLFIKYFNEIINGYINLNHNGLTWIVEPCKNLIDGIIKRWYVQSIDEKAMPMILPHINKDGSKEEVLIFRSPVMRLYRSENKFDFSNTNMNNIKTDLINYMKQYYKVYDNFEASSRNNIDVMDLDGLLDLVEIKETSNQQRYYISKNTILSKQINPITRRPVNHKIISKAISMEWGLRGLFNVGPLVGLYNDIPEKILISPRIGFPTFYKVVDKLLYKITGDIYSVEIKFEDGTVTPLFDISTSNLSKLERIVKELWKKGYFLNYWTSAVQKYIPDVKSFSVIITDPILLTASNSINDGNRAIEYLDNMNY